MAFLLCLLNPTYILYEYTVCGIPSNAHCSQCSVLTITVREEGRRPSHTHTKNAPGTIQFRSFFCCNCNQYCHFVNANTIYRKYARRNTFYRHLKWFFFQHSFSLFFCGFMAHKVTPIRRFALFRHICERKRLARNEHLVRNFYHRINSVWFLLLQRIS